MPIRNRRAELIHEHAERELINSANNWPVGKGLNFPYLAVNKHTQCNGHNNYRNRQQLRLSKHPKKQGENRVEVELNSH